MPDLCFVVYRILLAMKVQLKEVQAFKNSFELLFPDACLQDTARPFHSAITTAFHPTHDGTLLVAEDSGRSLSRVISARPCEESFACSHHWLDAFPERDGCIDVSTRRNLVEFHDNNGSAARVLSLVGQTPSTNWASPVMKAVDNRFVADLVTASEYLKCNHANDVWKGIQLDGSRGTIAVESAGEIIGFHGHQFPWRKTVSIRANDIFASLGISKRDHVACGVFDLAFVVSAGPWRLRLPIEFWVPAIDIGAAKKKLGRISNRVQFDSKDLAFILGHLKPYAKNVPAQQRVSLRLSDRIEVAIEEGYDLPQKRLVLSRSQQTGKPANIRMQSWHLRRIAKLGLTQLQWHGASQQFSHADERLIYICKSAPGIGGLKLPHDAIEIDSAAGSPVLA